MASFYLDPSVRLSRRGWQGCLHLQEGVRVPGYITQTPSLSRDIHPARLGFHFHESCLLSFCLHVFVSECMLACSPSSWWFCSLSKCCNYVGELLAAAICLCFSFSAARTRPISNVYVQMFVSACSGGLCIFALSSFLLLSCLVLP